MGLDFEVGRLFWNIWPKVLMKGRQEDPRQRKRCGDRNRGQSDGTVGGGGIQSREYRWPHQLEKAKMSPLEPPEGTQKKRLNIDFRPMRFILDF